MRKTIFILFIFITLVSNLISAEWSGVLDSTFNITRPSDDPDDTTFGLEHFTNLRLRIRSRERATFHAAFNLIVLSGNFINEFAHFGNYYFNDNYVAAMELERLYVMLSGEHIDSEIGLFRLNFGYGRVWGSSDFLNPRNPLALNARPRGVLGMNFSFYPADDTRMMAFVTGPSNPYNDNGGGYQPGFVIDQHWENMSIQTLYVYETALNQSPKGKHSIGLSLKYDLGISFIIDGLYRYNAEIDNNIDGLSIGTGFDYSLLSGNLYLLCEYLFNGSKSITSVENNGIWQNKNYLHGSMLYKFTDFVSFNTSAIYCIDDGSFMNISTINYELYQGFLLSLNANIPLDKTGELGSNNLGSFILNIGAKYRF